MYNPLQLVIIASPPQSHYLLPHPYERSLVPVLDNMPPDKVKVQLTSSNPQASFVALSLACPAIVSIARSSASSNTFRLSLSTKSSFQTPIPRQPRDVSTYRHIGFRFQKSYSRQRPSAYGLLHSVSFSNSSGSSDALTSDVMQITGTDRKESIGVNI